MTFLELVQELRRKVGAPGTGPVTTVSQIGESLDLVRWVQEAWHNVQAHTDDWFWMKRDFTLALLAGGGTRFLAVTDTETGLLNTRVARFSTEDSVRVYANLIGRADESFLPEVSFPRFRDSYDFGLASERAGRPEVFAISPRGEICVYPQVAENFTLTGRYQALPQPLALDEDVPNMPERFHRLIVYRAMELYARYESAPEVLAAAVAQADIMMAALQVDQLPQVSLGEPLA